MARSPLSAPIARVRATGATVRYGSTHNPRKGALRPMIDLRVTEPGMLGEHILRAPGYDYASVVARLDRIADRREQVADHAATD